MAFPLGISSYTSEHSSKVTSHFLQDETVGTGDDAHRPVVGQQDALEYNAKNVAESAESGFMGKNYCFRDIFLLG